LKKAVAVIFRWVISHALVFLVVTCRGKPERPRNFLLGRGYALQKKAIAYPTAELLDFLT